MSLAEKYKHLAGKRVTYLGHAGTIEAVYDQVAGAPALVIQWDEQNPSGGHQYACYHRDVAGTIEKLEIEEEEADNQ